MARVDNSGELELGGGERLRLVDYYSSPAGVSNLECVDADGSTKWTAELLDPKLGHYVSAEVVGDRIFAQSFDCFRVEFDRSTGRAIASQFTK